MLRNTEIVPDSIIHSKRKNYIATLLNKFSVWYEVLLKRPKIKNVLLITLIGTACVIISTLLIVLFGKRNSHFNLCTTTGCVLSAAKILESMNSSVDPCDDFYKYACGKWTYSHFIPLNEENSWFIERKQHVNYFISNVLEENSSSDIEPVSKMRELYNMCMDTEHLNRLGLTPLYRVLDLLLLPRSFPSNETVENFNLAQTLSLAQRILNADIVIQLSTHFNESSNVTSLSISPASNDQSLLYRKRRKAEPESDELTEKMLAVQLAYMIGIIVEFDTGEATENDILTAALEIILLESQLKMDKEATKETEEVYMTLDQLQDYMFSNITDEAINFTEHNFFWQDYITTLTKNLNINLTMESVIHVVNLPYFQLLADRFVQFNMLSFQRYVWWKVIALLAIHTTNTMRTHKYVFEERVYHVMAKSTRSSSCIEVIQSYFNEVLVYEMAKFYDIIDVKKEINIMITGLKEIFEDLILNSMWIGNQMKDRNIKILQSIKTLIGSPEIIFNSSWIVNRYKEVEIISNEFINTLLNIKARQAGEILNLIHHSHNSSNYERWFMDPMDVNAYYSYSINSIAVPFGILQYPFYIKSIHALNYGAIGSILGHEFTHAFHDESYRNGNDFEKKTALSKETAAEYLPECFITQYNNYTVKENLKVNGSATLSENVADYGGIRAIILAYERRLKQIGQEPSLPGLENYSHHQILFLSFANIWCLKESKSGIELRMRDEHSPNRFRVLGSLANLPEFARAWNCPLNSQMNPKKKCKLW